MFLTEVDDLICLPDALMYSIDGDGRFRTLKISSSVFPLFSFSLLYTIHESTSETHASMLAVELRCLAGMDLDER